MWETASDLVSHHDPYLCDDRLDDSRRAEASEPGKEKARKGTEGGRNMSELFASPFFGIALSIVAFSIGVWIQKKTGLVICNP